MNNRKLSNYTEVILIFVIIIWDAFKIYFSISSPIFQLIIYAPIVITYFLVNFNKTFIDSFFKPSNFIWFIWIVYVLFNTFYLNDFNNHRNQNPFVFISSILISFLFLIVVYNYKNNLKSLINVLIFSYFFRLCLSLVFDSSTIIEAENSFRFGSEFNSNSIANGALFIYILFLIKKQFKFKISKIEYIILLLSLYTMFITASKKVFISLIVFTFLLFIVNFEKKITLKIFKQIFVFALFSISFLFILLNSNVGKRIILSYTNTIETDNPEKMFDSRATQYIYGLELFKKHPINGIGLTNFVHESNIPTPLHSEILVQIVECGIIGFTLFLIFYLILIKKSIAFIKYYPEKKIFFYLNILILLIMFILFFGIPIYAQPMMWGLIAYVNRNLKNANNF